MHPANNLAAHKTASLYLGWPAKRRKGYKFRRNERQNKTQIVVLTVVLPSVSSQSGVNSGFTGNKTKRPTNGSLSFGRETSKTKSRESRRRIDRGKARKKYCWSRIYDCRSSLLFRDRNPRAALPGEPRTIPHVHPWRPTSHRA